MVYMKKEGGKAVIYTAIFGGKDGLIEPTFNIPGFDFVCFTDNPRLRSDIFDIRIVKAELSDPTRSARMYKILSHKVLPEYDYSVWIDGNVRLKKGNLRELLGKYLAKHDMALYRHPERECIHEEAQACIDFRKEDPTLLLKQVRHYDKSGYPRKNGLVMTSVLFRNHRSAKLREVNEQWWEELSRFSKRDQLSFNYVSWKSGFKPFLIGGNAYGNDLYERVNHKVCESVSDFHQVIEAKDKEIERLEAMVEELNASVPTIFYRRLKTRIEKIRVFSVKQLFEVGSKALRVLKKQGVSCFVKHACMYALHGRKYFQDKKLT